MKKLFLYRLFRHSKIAFVILLLFVACYAITFYKKMDMVFFPYNSMYTIDFTKTNTGTTYVMKINGSRINISRNPYWKKDFLETSLYSYCKYLRQGKEVFLNRYLQERISNTSMKNILQERLTPAKTAAINWPVWYAAFAGYTVPANADIELMQYDFVFDNNKAVLTDSISIYKTILP